MKNSWGFGIKHRERVLKAVVRYFQQTPVPIVVIVLAKWFGASLQSRPHCSIEGHSHIVFTRDPIRNNGLPNKQNKIQ
jgi:hypothetical protein